MSTDQVRRALRLWRRSRRALIIGWRATGRGVIEFYNSNNLTYASSIAYYSLLSFFPFILLVLTILTRLAADPGDERVVIDLVERALPSNFAFLSDQVVQLRRTPIPLTIAGALIMVWASMGVFGAITSAVDHAWATEKPHSYLKHQFIAFAMTISAGAVFMAALFVIGAVQVAHTGWFGTLERQWPWLHELTSLAAYYSLVPAAVVATGLVYYFAPNTKVRLRDVWFGAILAGILWRIALAGFSWYLGSVANFSVHGQVGAVVAFLVWVYLSAVILLYGVEVTAAYARLRKEIGNRLL